MEIRLTDRERRLGEWALVATALAHLLVPRLLLGLAARAYRLGLAVEFEPTDAAARRVRLVGVGMVAAVAIARRVAD
jgi:hypothetical protein